MYEKGVQTRNHIYLTAKKLFYAHGYEKTKIKDIIEMADTPIGLFTYYFKTKDKMVQEIYLEYYNRINTFMNESNFAGFENSILRHAVLSWIYYDLILNNDNNRRFYYEILKKGSNYRIANNFISHVYRLYIDDYHIVISENAFNNLLYIDFGGRREYFLKYFETFLNDSVDEVVFLLNGIIPRMLGIDQQEITTLLSRGIQIAKTIKTDNIHFLTSC